MTVNDIKDAMRAVGSHWFDPDTMRFFGTQVLPTVYQGPGGTYFITSEQPPHAALACTVRQFKPDTCDISTAGALAGYTRRAAMTMARALAAGTGQEPIVTTRETFKEISDMEQFVADCQKHGNHKASERACKRLMKLATSHHRYMEAQCNGEWPYGRDHDHSGGPPMVVSRCRKEITKIAAHIGASDVAFSGDPRGCTVKLTWSDGATDDWGTTGWCVPVFENR